MKKITIVASLVLIAILTTSCGPKQDTTKEVSVLIGASSGLATTIGIGAYLSTLSGAAFVTTVSAAGSLAAGASIIALSPLIISGGIGLGAYYILNND